MVSIEKLADELKLAGDKTRLTILSFLKERECCVCELAELLQTSQPNVSQHMRKLKDGRLVKESRRGQWIYYSLEIQDKPYLQDLLQVLPSQKEKVAQVSAETINRCQ
ncbi:metalloregulator ArsR/SmtB family transcription factor [Paenibacillus timonensis]|uniref:ArsR/SmtB family transcription factor n=1 Tax=Paenibacillus timonensis TaxID=225915 RepID=A0ABW3SAB0_9BACL|nr:metalloregulator ArsR/SmtB family transcription factor [Paenibacillus timonensis]MCH1638908.1 metalloregulator ArsR/SmtB family transcription factor [Paenibacillus timonensis]